MQGAKDTQTMVCHPKADTAQINYCAACRRFHSVRLSAVDKLATTLLA
jgi:hypothetical protein